MVFCSLCILMYLVINSLWIFSYLFKKSYYSYILFFQVFCSNCVRYLIVLQVIRRYSDFDVLNSSLMVSHTLTALSVLKKNECRGQQLRNILCFSSALKSFCCCFDVQGRKYKLLNTAFDCLTQKRNWFNTVARWMTTKMKTATISSLIS